MDLGAPIGSHGAGHGVGGGHGIATSQNTQAGMLAREDGFNSGVGGAHASGDIPRGTPIADKFSNSGNTPEPYGQGQASSGRAGERLDNSLDNFTGEHVHSHSHGQGQGQAVSGAYSGGSTRDALTGQSGHTTGAGVGPLAENLGSSGEHHHSHQHHHDRQAHSHSHTGAAVGAGAIAGGAAGYAGHQQYEQAYGHSDAQATSTAPLTRGEGVAGLKGGLVPGVGGGDGSSGIGPGGSDGAYTESRREPGYGNLGAGAGGVGAGAAGIGAGELYSSSHSHGGDYNNNNNQGSSGNGAKIAEGGLSGTGGKGVNEPGTGGGKYGRAEHDSSTGQPLSNPKDLDTGNPHSLIFDKASGKYVHRRDLEGGNHSSRV